MKCEDVCKEKRQMRFETRQRRLIGLKKSGQKNDWTRQVMSLDSESDAKLRLAPQNLGSRHMCD